MIGGKAGDDHAGEEPEGVEGEAGLGVAADEGVPEERSPAGDSVEQLARAGGLAGERVQNDELGEEDPTARRGGEDAGGDEESVELGAQAGGSGADEGLEEGEALVCR